MLNFIGTPTLYLVGQKSSTLLVVALWASLAVSAVQAATINEYPTTRAPSGLIKGPDGNIWFGDSLYHMHVGNITAGGKVTEYPVDISSNIVVGADGGLWFTAGNNQIKKYTASGEVTSYTFITTYSQTHELLAGADGNIWFTDTPGKQIIKVVPDGSTTAYPLPNAITLDAIAMGADGNIWFAENVQHLIAKMTPNGSLTQYQMPGDGIQVQALVLGVDGNLWFTDYLTHQVGNISPNGLITEYPTPTPNSFPQSLVAGPDGNLWFIERWVNKLAKITPSGQITEYAIPFAKGLPTSLAVGKDGILWFTDEVNNAIVSSTPTGVMSQYLIPTPGSKPTGIIVTADGKVWFSESNSNKIATVLFDNYIETSVNPANFGQAVILTATVIGKNAAGNVQFMDGSIPLGNPVILSGGKASITASTLTVGSHNITAVYSGDAQNASQTLPVLQQIVKPVPLQVSEFSFLSEQKAPIRNGGYRDPVIAVGADGNLWFIDAYLWANQPGIASIDKITPGGTITAYPIGLSHRDSFSSMQLAPDGNVVVFKNYGGVGSTIGSISGISPNGNIVSYYTGGVVEFGGFGVDGSLLFKDCGNGAAGKIAADGKVTVTPSSSIYFAGCEVFPDVNIPITGPDGNTWATDVASNSIIKTSPSGTVTPYTLPNPDSYPYRIVAGADGNIWFTETAGRIGKITLDHVSSSLNPSSYGQPVTLSARVSGASPTGTVQFMEGNTPLSTLISLNGGVATFNTSALTVGSHRLTAVYSGDANNTPQVLSALTQVVGASPTPTPGPSSTPSIAPTPTVNPTVTPTVAPVVATPSVTPIPTINPTPVPTATVVQNIPPTPVIAEATLAPIPLLSGELNIPVIGITPSRDAASGSLMTISILSPQADLSYELCYGNKTDNYDSACIAIKATFSFKMLPNLNVYGAVRATNAQGKSSAFSNELHVSATEDDVNWDAVTQIASFRDVMVKQQHYRVKLKLQNNQQFSLISADFLDKQQSAQPAVYDDNRQDLKIPVVQVSGRYYQVLLHNVGQYSFRLDQIDEIK